MRGKKMKHKIYLQFCLIAALAILITTTIVTALFYQRFKAQVFSFYPHDKNVQKCVPDALWKCQYQYL